ncbi:MAG: hypothetical protein LBQ08_01940, partial [Holosporaceae bacterium]|nr:hypothetical protein [Holosporaceae bacterium]
MKKLGAWLGIISILWSNMAFAMLPQRGALVIRGRNISIVGAPTAKAIVQDVSSVMYEDFDVTAFSLERFSMDSHRHIAEERKAQTLHLDSGIPFVGGKRPKVDYKALSLLPLFIAEQLNDKVHPKIQSGALKFIEIIARNEATLDPTAQVIPDIDCLYYKMVDDQQRLFLRLSSQTRQEAEVFKRASSGKTLFVESGEISLQADRDMTLDHVVADADNITCVAGQTIFNRASKMKAKWVIRLKAGKQRHETVINKWVRQESGKHHYTHAEGVESVDDCRFVARKVIQEGDDVENFGIFIEAEEFEDRGVHTVNMPAKITLFNYAWAEDEDLFSSASSSVTKRDDVLVPARYHVNYYRSLPSVDGRETSVRFGYTIINSGSKIEVLKDVKEDAVVEEKHSLEIHEEKSGFSICGGVSVPDPTLQLQRMHSSYRSKNMIGLTTSAISAVAKGIQIYEDYKVAKELATSSSPWNLDNTLALLQTLSHYVNGPSVQFGSRSVDITQEQVLSHGNTFISPMQVFHNSRMSSFAGTYHGQDVDIKTKTFVTFALPQTSDSRTSVHQSGVSLDLLSFGIALMNPAIDSTLAAALAASSISISFQDMETHQTVYLPTTMHASHSLKIEAEDGELTQAQIKAGLIHAIFTH